MGQLVNPEPWQSVLRLEVFSALNEWVADVPFDLVHLDWFNDGRSGFPVAHVLRKGPDRHLHLVMKFCAPGERPHALGAAWTQSAPFREKHLAKMVEDALPPLAGWRAVFLHIAGDDLSRYQALSKLRGSETLPRCSRVIVRSVIRDWNGANPFTDRRSVGEVLLSAIGNRLPVVERWVRERGVTVDAARIIDGDGAPCRNPFTLVSGVEANLVIDDLLIGKAHGDLSGRNVLVPADPKPEARSYVLIDYDHFRDDAPLAWDPMHLLVALVLDDFDKYGRGLRGDLIKVVVDPETAGIHEGVGSVRALSRAIRNGAKRAFKEGGYGASWREQFLLCLVGVGLVHVGRDLRTEIPDDAKEWCFNLAISAAEAYVREYRAARPANDVITASADRPMRRSGRQAWPIIDRENEQSALRGRLAEGPFGAVVVNGLAGVGKSKVLRTVLDQVPDDPRVGSSARVLRRTVDAATRLDLKTFIDLLDDGAAGPTSARGKASLARLEAVLNRVSDRQVILAIDAAENLLKPGTQELADLDLDEALELLTTEPDHRVSVVLAFRRQPTSPTGGTWPDVNGVIPVPQLKIAEFFDYLGSLDQSGALGLDDLDDAFRRELHQHLLGNPRHAELVHALVTTVDRSIGLRTLADEVSNCRAQDVPERLTWLLAERLGPTRRRVLEALAAFGTPVHGDVVVSVLAAEHAESDVRQALDVLSFDRVAYRNDDGEYFLPNPEASIFLNRMDVEARSNLLADAADELSASPAGTVTGVPDLRIRFAELNALLGAGLHRLAYFVIETIDQHLRKWNCSYLLARQRTDVRTKLDDDHLEMANENALAGIHVSRREFPDAREAYEVALAKATALGDRASKLKIHLNQAAMYLENNRTRQAQDLFELVRNDPGRVNDLSIQMGALEGLADCHRRHGRYDQAIESAKLALDLPKLTAFPDTRSAAEFSGMRTVVLSLKLARWYAELGDLKTANEWMNAADITAAADEWLRPACLDGRADLLLAESDLAEAIGMAREAVDRALATQDPITLLRARTTLCVAHLRTGQMVEARREIVRAERYRRPGQSLLVLALLALVTRHAGDSYAADRLFRKLEDQSRRRIDADDDDFASRDLLGFAISGRALDDKADLRDAVECFRTARERTPRTPGLVGRLRALLGILDSCGREPGLLWPAIEALGDIGAGS